MTKSTVKKAADKTEVKTPVVKAEAAKNEVKEAVKEEVKAEAAEKKPAVKAAPAKKAIEKAAPAAEKKPAVRKEPVKKEAAPKPVKEAEKSSEVRAEISIQFSGKDYSMEKLMNIAKDVWQYDLGRKAEDFRSAQLYVKPEENAVYYVLNEEVKGSFAI